MMGIFSEVVHGCTVWLQLSHWKTGGDDFVAWVVPIGSDWRVSALSLNASVSKFNLFII